MYPSGRESRNKVCPAYARTPYPFSRDRAPDLAASGPEPSRRSFMKTCSYCGEPVSDGDWDDCLGHRIWICGKPECQRELRLDYEANVADARWKAEQDNYERYQ